MKRLAAIGLLAALFVCPLIGCQGGGDDEATEYVPRPEAADGTDNDLSVVGTSNSSESSPAHQGATIPANATPEQIVRAYLDALQAEDYRTAEDLLTQAARDAFFQANLQPSLPGPLDSKFLIEQVRFATQKKERGYVATAWTEMTEQGQPITYSVDIYVRQEVPNVWRVAGMMMDVDENKFVFFNFEDAADMMNENQGLDSNPEVRQAQDPGDNVIR